MTPQTRETVQFVLGIGTFAITAGAIVWKALEYKLRVEIQAMSAKLELRDREIEHLQDKITLSVNGLQERFAHFSTRSRGEVDRLGDRLGEVEDFLVKSTDFKKRKSNHD